MQTTFKLKPKYTIKSVSYTPDSITIEFDKNIDRSYIDFFEKKYKNYSRDYFDIKGSFEFAKKTKIKLEGIDRTTIYQHKKDILRIYLQNKENPKTIYIISKNKIIIKHLYVKPKKAEENACPKGSAFKRELQREKI